MSQVIGARPFQVFPIERDQPRFQPAAFSISAVSLCNSAVIAKGGIMVELPIAPLQIR